MKAIAIMKNTVGDDCCGLFDAYRTLAEVYTNEQKWVEAEPLYIQLITPLQKTNRENSFACALAHRNLAIAYQR